MATGSVRFGHLAAAWALLFALLHVFWAVGGSWLLESSAGAALAADRPRWFVLLGLWGAAVVLLAGAALGWTLARRRTGGPATYPAAPLAYLGGACLLLRGLVVEVVLLTDAGGVAANVGVAQARTSLVLWNPWFIVGGGLFVAAGVQDRRAHARSSGPLRIPLRPVRRPGGGARPPARGGRAAAGAGRAR